MTTPKIDAIRNRLVTDFLGAKLIDNNLRGYWCEAMLAEALGRECRISSHGWHPWDLQICPNEAEWPERIRIQVKNAARLQTWNAMSGKLSDANFKLAYKRRPSYFFQTWPGVPCDEIGFHCEVFALCYHPVEDAVRADHRDPDQWQVYLLPAVGPRCGITPVELEACRRAVAENGRTVSYAIRTPATLEKGIRGRPSVPPRSIRELSVGLIRSLVG